MTTKYDARRQRILKPLLVEFQQQFPPVVAADFGLILKLVYAAYDAGGVQHFLTDSPPKGTYSAEKMTDEEFEKLTRWRPMTNERVTEQTPPEPNDSPAIWDLVMADFKDRDAEGRRKYGTPLQANNGRDPLIDAYQEALDLVVYLRQAIEERGR